MKIGVLLHGNGVYDGTEIHEAVLTLLALAEVGAETVCIAPDVDQYHAINHLTGEEMPETRNVLVESARIARGNIRNLATLTADELDGLVMPGGFGTAKNITKWAFEGPQGAILEPVKQFILDLISLKKPIVALCMSPTTLAKALEGSGISATLTVGSDREESPYEISGIAAGITSLGHHAEMKTVREISVDRENKIISAPCYMMEASILDVRDNIRAAIDEMVVVLREE
ncbi:isoprenoid biosynthesis glyoxalase ElbB [Larkinella punicea]|uniref:Isoprenoid biosynthesis protein ElbB n=1 Tax=Larkinella punicea TaxID=2315727 RepID=A0A368JQS0_9BACT|nr:isoprenoid biosynthesis glyoxalase ElbB [Larkinella punicea]RCR68943.1 isoprenoid biosynthesis protein ElbB [Larkinella punicea]